eukprot:IDg2337t1
MTTTTTCFATAPASVLLRSRRRTHCARAARPRNGAGCTHASTAPAALILDCDGVIVESEELHRIAYNATWKAHELGFQWGVSEYASMQNSVGGGKEKLKWYLDTNGAWPAYLQDANARRDFITMLHKDKTARGVVVAVASAASRPAVEVVLRGSLGAQRVDRLACVLAGDDVERKKPHPDIYNAAVKRVGVERDRCVVVEDSLVGVRAAVAAGLRVFVTHTDYTADQDFSDATAVFPDLGEPGDKYLVTIDTLFPHLAALPKV